MRHSRGSLSLIFLIGVLFLLSLAHLLLSHVKKDYERTIAYAENLQIRKLCAELALWGSEHTEQLNLLRITHAFSPHNQVLIQGTGQQSGDNMFSWLHIRAEAEDREHHIKRLRFSLSDEMRILGENFMFISSAVPIGAESLSDSSLYTSTGSFTMPMIGFLKGKAHANLDMFDLHEYGFDNNFFHLTQNTVITYLSTAKITRGNELIACEKSITLNNYFKAPERLILISDDSIRIGQNVELDNVLIIAKRDVVFGAGCKVKGVVFSGGKITLPKNGSFIHDAACVATYASAYFIA